MPRVEQWTAFSNCLQLASLWCARLQLQSLGVDISLDALGTRRYEACLVYLGLESSLICSHGTPLPSVLSHKGESGADMVSRCCTCLPTSPHRLSCWFGGAPRTKLAKSLYLKTFRSLAVFVSMKVSCRWHVVRSQPGTQGTETSTYGATPENTDTAKCDASLLHPNRK